MTVLKVAVVFARQMRIEQKRTVGLYHPYLPRAPLVFTYVL